MSHFPKLAILTAALLSLPVAAAAHPGMHPYGAPANPVRQVVVNYDNGAVMDERDSAYASQPLPCARSYSEDDYGSTHTVDMRRDRPTFGGACWLPRNTDETVDVRDDDVRDVVYDDDMPPPPPPPPGAVPCTCVVTGGGYAYETRRPVEVRREVIIRQAPQVYSSRYSDAYGSTYEDSYSESSESYSEGSRYEGGVVYSRTYDDRYDDRHDDRYDRDRRDDHDHDHHRRHHDRGHDRDDDRNSDRAHHDVWFNRY